jgi:molybdopterin molybdotransferase
MVTADEALEMILDNVAALGTERVAILDAVGRVLAEQVRSPRDIPPFDNSAMDGYALRAADVAGASEARPVALKVIETVGAGTMPRLALEPGQATRTMTGAPLAPGADAIVPVERTRMAGQDVVEILASAEAGAFVRRRGEDVGLDEAVLSQGRRLTPADIGMLASLNRSVVHVQRRPRVAIVTTGDELVDIDHIPAGAEVVNSNAYALAGAVREAGCEAVILAIARDRLEEIRDRLGEALAFDAVLSSGGVSVGQFDYVARALEEVGMRELFHGVAQKPGRPLAFGTIGWRPLFGLPGNPVSTLLCFYLYARPALLRMAGRRDLGLARIGARCGVDLKLSAGLTDFVRVRLERPGGETVAMPTGAQGSGILSSVSRADGLLVGPAALAMLRAGDQATVLLLAADAAADCEPFFEDRHRRQKN